MATLPVGIRERGDSLVVDVSYKGIRKTATIEGLDRVEKAKALQASIQAQIMNSPNAQKLIRLDSWTLGEAFEHIQSPESYETLPSSSPHS